MPKSKKLNEIIVHVKTEAMSDFFERGKLLAKRLDRGEKPIFQRIISFEDPEDLIKFLTQTKRALIAAIRKKPKSVSSLANELHRSRSAIDKDIQMLESIGIVESEYVINPGHGRCRIIKTADSNPIKLRVETII
ncbi:MAG: HTH domain-containing protein [Gammaproteobacteria bacterium]|nr:HTH domain-containing protein [Gammaproteobacteria bacterium]